MDIEEIKSELISRCSGITIPKPQESSDPIKAFQNQISSMEEQSDIGAKKITDVLNEILESKHIEFSNDIEMEEFILGMKSTIEDILQELVQRAI